MERQRRLVSPLTWRILAVNVLALVVLAGGILYLDQFRVRLVEQRLEELKTQAALIAAALAEVSVGDDLAPALETTQARALIGRLTERTNVRARLFAQDGALLADTRYMFPDRAIASQNLSPADSPWRDPVFAAFNYVVENLSSYPRLERYVEPPAQRAFDYPEAVDALRGEPTGQLRRDDEGVVLVNVAVPVQRFRRVLGVLMVTADTQDIAAVVRSERLTFMQIFLAALGLTLLLSMFLARTIARPIRQLAAAADQVRLGRGRTVEVPRYARREDEIGLLSRSLSDMTGTLNARLDAIEAFAADVAHEIKNPLSSMRSALETLDRTKDPKLQAQLMAILDDDVARLDRLITDISEASRLDAELSRESMRPLDMGAQASALVEAYKLASAAQADKARPPVRYSYQGGQGAQLTVNGLESRLGQVLRNLVDNAASFSPAGGTVRLAAQRNSDWVRVTVEDEGPGIPAENLDDIFRRFYSERPQGEAFGQHSGLGLAIAKQIVEAHGGRIWAENRMEGTRIAGARFIVELPAAA
jgi:two-component system, OmpR family, sensor histidine kinase ChvG